jgi:hypothetical protein
LIEASHVLRGSGAAVVEVVACKGTVDDVVVRVGKLCDVGNVPGKVTDVVGREFPDRGCSASAQLADTTARNKAIAATGNLARFRVNACSLMLSCTPPRAMRAYSLASESCRGVLAEATIRTDRASWQAMPW